MSEKKTGNKKLKNEPSDIKEKKIAATGSPLKSMTIWIALGAIILSVLFSRETQDSVMVIRYVFLSGFSLIFIVWFYLYGKAEIKLPVSGLVKTVFLLSIGFAVWSIISMMCSVNISNGYIDTGRHLLNIVVLFIIMQAVMREDFDVIKICKALVIVALIQSFVGIMQNYDLAFTDLPGKYKPYGLMANRNLFGAAQMLLMPFAVFVLCYADRKWKYLSVVALMGLVVSVIISQTRSAWIGSVSFFIVSLLLVLLFLPQQRKMWLIGSLTGMIGIITLISLLILSDEGGKLSESITKRIESFTKTDNSADESINDRLQIWKQTVKVANDNLMLGVGPGNWKIAVLKYGSEGMTWSYGYYVPDHAHSVYLQIQSETGIPGTLLYFGVWVLLGIIAFKSILSSSIENERMLIILMLAGFSGFACISMFLLPAERIEHSFYVVLMAGIVMGIYLKINSFNSDAKPLHKKILITGLTIIVVANIFLGLEKYRFELHTMWAKAYKNANRHLDVIKEVNAGKSRFVSLDLTGNPLEWYSSVAYQGLKQYDKALEQAEIAHHYHPNSARILNTFGNIYVELKQFDKAIEYYEKALMIIPNYVIVQKNLAYNYYNVGRYGDAIEIFKKINLEGDEYSKEILRTCQKRAAQQKKLPINY